MLKVLALAEGLLFEELVLIKHIFPNCSPIRVFQLLHAAQQAISF